MKNKSPNLKFFIGVFVILLGFSSCVTRKDITYFQNIDNKSDSSKKLTEESPESFLLRTGKIQVTIQPGDILDIALNSLNQEATSMFSFLPASKSPLLGATGQSNVANLSTSGQSFGFLVDINGNIQFPILGDILVKGKTTLEIKKYLEELLSKFLESPKVSIRFVNFKVTLMGDVNKPGVYSFQNERVSLFEALASAGDLTIFGNRRQVKVIRENGAENQVTTLDLRDVDILKTKVMYLHPNDIVYVEPGKGKIASADLTFRILPMVLTGLNVVALILTRFK